MSKGVEREQGNFARSFFSSASSLHSTRPRSSSGTLSIVFRIFSQPVPPTLSRSASTMGLSKKDARTREQKKKEEQGIKVETTKGGVVKKAPKTQIKCTVCMAMLTESMPIILRDHAAKHSKLKTPQECFPGATIAA